MPESEPPKTLDYATPVGHAQLRREVGLGGAVLLGLGSMIGTGAFVSIGIATGIAYSWTVIAVLIAGFLALCNAMSSAQLAAAHPVSGGTYEYGYRLLTPSLGFIAGWTFLLAKSASAATAALALARVVADLLLDSPSNSDAEFAAQILAPLIPAIMTFVVFAGIRRSNQLNIAIVTVTFIGFAWLGEGMVHWVKLRPPRIGSEPLTAEKMRQILEATAICFVAFTGYGRLATLGEEVKEPRRTIPRAILLTLSICLVLYLLIAIATRSIAAFNAIGWQGTLVDLGKYASRGSVWNWVSIAAVTAMLGVLLNLVLGLSRVWLAMGRRGDMPAILARVNEKHSTPGPAVILTGIVIAGITLVNDLKIAWSFSAFTVLIYYAITNLAALRLPREQRLYPRVLAWIGLLVCISLAWFVEMRVWIVGVALIGVGLIWHFARRRFLAKAIA